MSTTDDQPGQTLQKGLKQRHLTMIAIGGVIGAGLFVGIGAPVGLPVLGSRRVAGEAAVARRGL